MEFIEQEKKKVSLGIYGAGWVGSTCYQAFHQLDNYDVKAFDAHPDKCLLGKSMGTAATFVSLDELAKCDIVFIALPTPFKMSTGECDTSIVERGVAQVRAVRKDNLIVIKSTIPPGTTKKLNFSYGNICFNPEFLTEDNAYKDFINLEYQIIGVEEAKGQDLSSHPMHVLYRDCFAQGIMKCEETTFVTSTTAETIKYVKNCYLATRLSFFNEVYQVCQKLDINYNIVKEFAGKDPRIGNHYNLIDDDKFRFYGKSCLPKDINAFIYLAKKFGVNPNVLEASWKTNLERSEGRERDWEKMDGRAIVKE